MCDTYTPVPIIQSHSSDIQQDKDHTVKEIHSEFVAIY